MRWLIDSAVNTTDPGDCWRSGGCVGDCCVVIAGVVVAASAIAALAIAGVVVAASAIAALAIAAWVSLCAGEWCLGYRCVHDWRARSHRWAGHWIIGHRIMCAFSYSEIIAAFRHLRGALAHGFLYAAIPPAHDATSTLLWITGCPCLARSLSQRQDQSPCREC